jgi:hypothetical protein
MSTAITAHSWESLGVAYARPVKLALKLGIFLTIGVTAGLEVTEFCWRYHFRTLRDAHQVSFTLSAEQRAQSAYFGHDPELAELELARLLNLPLLHIDPREQAFRRFVARARLAKVQQAQGKQAEAEKNFQAALTLMHTAFPDANASSADDVLKALTTIDNAAEHGLRSD